MTVTGLENLAAALLGALAESAIRALLLAAVTGGVLVVFRLRRTAWRLGAWTIVLWAALAMPVLGRVLPAWRVPVAGLPALAWLQPAAPTVEPGPALLRVQAPTSTAVASSVAPRDLATTPAVPSLVPSAPVATPRPASNATPGALSLSRVLIGIYLLGLIALSCRAAIGWMATLRLDGAARPIEDADALARLARIASSVSLRHPPRLVESSQLFVPVTLSVTRPVVILPDSWRDWDGAMLEAVLAHEVAHVARRDALTQRVSLLYRAICWFNPLAWWLPHQLTELAERASDEAVLSAGTSQTQYARMLLEFFRAIPQPGHRADWHVAMARGAAANAEARVERILAWKGGQTMRLTKSVVLLMVLAVTPGVALTAAVRPAAMAPDPALALQTQTAPIAASVPAPPPAAARPADVASAMVQTPRPQTATEPPHSDTAAATATKQEDTPPAPQTPTSLQTSPPPSYYWQRPPTPIQEGFGAGAYRPGNGVTFPVVIREAKPDYTDDAISARIEGAVELEIFILPDGTVGPVRVTKSLDARYGLDNEAVRAVRQWIFKPAQLDGRPVPVVVSLILEFKIASPSAQPRPPGGAARLRPLADEFASGAYLTFGGGMVAPQPLGPLAEKYTPDAMRAKLGAVVIEATVNPDGTIAKAHRVGVVAPQLVRLIVPRYTPDAMQEKIQGQVDVELIVMPDGTVGKVRIIRSLDPLYGLDEQALIAARQSTFVPGTLDGNPVPVLVTMTFEFKLH